MRLAPGKAAVNQSTPAWPGKQPENAFVPAPSVPGVAPRTRGTTSFPSATSPTPGPPTAHGATPECAVASGVRGWAEEAMTGNSGRFHPAGPAAVGASCDPGQTSELSPPTQLGVDPGPFAAPDRTSHRPFEAAV